MNDPSSRPHLSLQTLLTSAVISLLALSDTHVAVAWPFQLDEGERLSTQIGNAAQKLARSQATEVTITYEPRAGIDQHYTVGLAKVRYQPHPPFEPPYPGLTVTVEKGRSGFANFHVQFVGVPRSFGVVKYRAATQIVLRKEDGEVDVVAVN